MVATYGSAVYGDSVYASSGVVLTPADAASLGFSDVDLTATRVTNTRVRVDWRNPTTAHQRRLIVRSPLGFPPDPDSPQSVVLLDVDATDDTDPNFNITSLEDVVPPGSEVFYTFFVLVESATRTTVVVGGTNTGGGGDTGGDTGGDGSGGGTITPPPPPPPVTPPSTVTGTALMTSQVRITASGTTFTPAGGGGGLTYWYENPNIEPSTGVTIYTGSGSLGSAMAAVPAGGTLVLKYSGIVTENINIALHNNVTITNAKGYLPWLNGQLRISGGENFRIWGLNVKWTTPNTGAHMIYLDGGSGEFAYAEVTMQGNSQGCYTLLRPGQAIHDWRCHHLWIHDNPGVTSHDGNQDHGFYCSAENATQNGQIDHCLIENMPRGRNIKIGGASAGGPIGDILVTKTTLRTGYGPSNGQVSNGATNTEWSYLLLIDSGASTGLTNGSGSGSGNTYHHCKADRVVGPAVTNFANGGNNVNSLSVPTLTDYVTQGAAGYGHLAA